MEQDQPQPLIRGLIPHNRRRFSFAERRRFFFSLPKLALRRRKSTTSPTYPFARHSLSLCPPATNCPRRKSPPWQCLPLGGFPLTSLLPRTRSGRPPSTPRQTKSALARRPPRTFPRVRARPTIFRFLPSPFTSRPKPLTERELRGEGFPRFCLHLPLPLRSSAQRRVRSLHPTRIFITQSINLQNKG